MLRLQHILTPILSSKIIPTYSKGPGITHWLLLGLFEPPREPKNNPKHPKAVIFYLALFKMDKMILRQPNFISVTTLPNKSILPIPRNSEYEICGPWAPQQSPETTKCTLNAVALTLAWLWTVKIMLQEPQFNLYPPVLTPPSQETLSYISGFPEAPFNAQKQPKKPQTLLHFP